MCDSVTQFVTSSIRPTVFEASICSLWYIGRLDYIHLRAITCLKFVKSISLLVLGLMRMFSIIRLTLNSDFCKFCYEFGVSIHVIFCYSCVFNHFAAYANS